MRPTVLCFSGLDPSGGAGLQADIEAIGQTGSHAAVACTALTIQDSQRVYNFQTVTPSLLKQQALAVLNDLPVACFKSGMLGSAKNVQVVRDIVQQYPHIPYVFDTVLVANSGGSLGDINQLMPIFKTLLPYASILTPNTFELRALTGQSDIDTAARQLFDEGARALLIKGAHEQHSQAVEHWLWIDGQCVAHSYWPRLMGEFHGSGCSLAGYIAGLLAQGIPLRLAVPRAELWLHETLRHADSPHTDGQKLPFRVLQ